jgi:hypothetical protein
MCTQRCIRARVVGIAILVAAIAALVAAEPAFGRPADRMATDSYVVQRWLSETAASDPEAICRTCDFVPGFGLVLQYSAVSTQPVAGESFAAVHGSWSGTWDGTGVNMQGGKPAAGADGFCTASILPGQAGGSVFSLGWGDQGPMWYWPASNDTSWAWQIPSGTAGDTLAVECAPIILKIRSVVEWGVPATIADFYWVCSSWNTSSFCVDTPDFRASWTITGG